MEFNDIAEVQDYLKRKIEPPRSDDEKEKVQEIKKLLNREVTPTSQETLINSGEYRGDHYTFSAQFADYDVMPLIKSKPVIERLIYDILLRPLNPDHRTREVTSFSVTNNQTQRNISLTEIIPPGWRVLHNSESPALFSSTLADDRLIVIGGNLTSLELVFVLLHELGHANYFTNAPAEEYTAVYKEHTKYTNSLWNKNLGKYAQAKEHRPGDKAIATELRSERNADAFALLHIRSILDPKDSGGITREVMNTLTHRDHLYLNTENMKPVLSKKM